ncbi:hypothetical protein SNE40_000189 [Patella caerulea]|uniref:Uncharacterized protein n=1 Tax=Patella caerulea TaxID=87958 RepID=A0AAN8Q1X3_PATCE
MRCLMITVCIVLCTVTFGESKIRSKRQAAYGYGAVDPAAYGGAAVDPAQYSAYGAAANPAAYQPAYQPAVANPAAYQPAAYAQPAYQQAAANPAYAQPASPYGYATII